METGQSFADSCVYRLTGSHVRETETGQSFADSYVYRLTGSHVRQVETVLLTAMQPDIYTG